MKASIPQIARILTIAGLTAFVAVGCGRAHRHNAAHLHVQVTAGGHCFMQEDPADAAARVRAHLLG